MGFAIDAYLCSLTRRHINRWDGNFLIWNDLSSAISCFSFFFFLSSPVILPCEAAQVAVEVAIATVDHSDIRGSKPHNRDPSGAASD
jgi:hypothetical protein